MTKLRHSRLDRESSLKTLPKEAVKIEEATTPWYADEVQKRIDEYQSGNMKTAPLDQAFLSFPLSKWECRLILHTFL